MVEPGTSSLIEDTLKITEIDREGKVFQHVSRAEGSTELYDIKISVDFNSDLYPVEVGQYHSILLTNTLTLDPQEQEGGYVLHRNYKNTLLEKFDYCMHGKVYKHVLDRGNSMGVFISFGGLIMSLNGAAIYLSNIELDSNVYCLMRKLY